MISVEQAALRLGKSPQVIRILLQRGLLPFGFATKMPNSSVYTYIIYPEKFKEFCGEIEDQEEDVIVDEIIRRDKMLHQA